MIFFRNYPGLVLSHFKLRHNTRNQRECKRGANPNVKHFIVNYVLYCIVMLSGRNIILVVCIINNNTEQNQLKSTNQTKQQHNTILYFFLAVKTFILWLVDHKMKEKRIHHPAERLTHFPTHVEIIHIRISLLAHS